MSFFWSLREGAGALRRARLAGLLATLSLATISGMAAVGVGLADSVELARDRLLARFELEAFLRPGREDRVEELAEWLEQREAVLDVTIVSKQEAASRFAEQYGGEIFGLLEENPLPPSIIIRYDPSVVTSGRVVAEAAAIEAREDVDEVAYEGQLLARLEELVRRLSVLLLAIAAVVALIALLLTTQAIRVAVRASADWAHVIRLIGGRDRHVRSPFFWTGALAGAAGGLIGTTLVAAVQLWQAGPASFVAPPDWRSLAIVAVSAVLLGALAARGAAPRKRERGRS